MVTICVMKNHVHSLFSGTPGKKERTHTCTYADLTWCQRPGCDKQEILFKWDTLDVRCLIISIFPPCKHNRFLTCVNCIQLNADCPNFCRQVIWNYAINHLKSNLFTPKRKTDTVECWSSELRLTLYKITLWFFEMQKKKE